MKASFGHPDKETRADLQSFVKQFQEELDAPRIAAETAFKNCETTAANSVYTLCKSHLYVIKQENHITAATDVQTGISVNHTNDEEELSCREEARAEAAIWAVKDMRAFTAACHDDATMADGVVLGWLVGSGIDGVTAEATLAAVRKVSSVLEVEEIGDEPEGVDEQVSSSAENVLEIHRALYPDL